MSSGFELASDGGLMSLFGAEVYRLAVAVQLSAGRAFDSCPEPAAPSENLLSVNQGVHSDLTAAIGHAALLKKLLWPRETKPNEWSHERWRFYQRRVSLLREPLGGVEFQALANAGVRNSLEHYDEYLDREVIRISTGRYGSDTVHVVTDVVFSTRELWETFAPRHDAKTIMLRVFISDERVLVNAGREIDVGALHDDCRTVQQRLDTFTGGAMAAGVDGAAVHVWVSPQKRPSRTGPRG